MFEDRLEAAIGSPGALARLGADTHHELKSAGCRKLLIAAAWADAHSAVDRRDGVGKDSMLAERLVEMGPTGCPLVAETCPAELAVVFQTSIGGAKGLIRDALNLRHRLPHTWARVVAGEVHAWKAREIAQRTAHLNPLRACEVDRLMSGHIELVAWRRFETMLDATLLHVDEATYHERARRAATHRDVWATQSSDGHRTLIALADSGDVTGFLALVNRIAEALANEGDDDPIGARRAKAIGIAGYPDRALDLLLRHCDDPDVQQHPEERQAAALDALTDPTDPWAPEPCSTAWETEQHGNYHQPTLNDPADADCLEGYERDHEAHDEHVAEPEDPVDEADQEWLCRQLDDNAETCPELVEGQATPSPELVEGPEPISPTCPSTSSGHTDRRWTNSGGLNLPAALAAFSKLDAATLTGLLAKARPHVIIHLHLSDEAVSSGRGVVRTDHGPITVDQLRRFLGDTGGDITVQPVFDPGSVAAVDSYEIPLALRRAVAIRTPGSVFPYSPTLTGASGAGRRTDLDHTLRYRRGGPPGQTRSGNLGPLARGEHRARTVGEWSVRQPDPGAFVWRTPQGWISITTNQGTLVLGDNPWAKAIWRAAQLPIANAA